MCRTNLYTIYMRLIFILRTVNCDSENLNAFDDRRKHCKEKIMRAALILAILSLAACAGADTPSRNATVQTSDDDKGRCNRPDKDRPGRPCPWDHP